MKKQAVTLSILSILLLAACTPTKPPARRDTNAQPIVNDEDKNAMMKKDAEKEDAMMDENQIKKDEGAMMKKEESMEKEEAMMAVGAYTDHASNNLPASILADGNTKVLFFHAAWCPTCRNAEAELMQWYADQGFPLTVYKINYDNETDLKSRYGVTYQHTFVKVDGQGNLIQKIQGPTDEQLMTLLQK